MSKGFNSLPERFLVIVTVTSFMLCIAALLGPVLNNSEMERIFINWFTFFVLGLSGVIFVLIQQIFAREKIKPYLHIVACVFYVIFAVILSGLCRQMNQPYVLIPFLIIEYFLENALNNIFVFHDRFMEECGDFTGKELEAHLFHNNLSAIDFGAKARFAQGLLCILPAVMFAVLFCVLKSGYSVNILELVLIGLFFLSEALIFLLTGLFKNDVFFGFLGFRDYVQNKKKLFRSAFVILFAAFIFGLVFSSNHAFIKISFKEKPAPEVNYEIEPQQSYEQSGNLDIREMLEEMYPDDGKFPAWIWDVIFGIIKWAAIAALTVWLVMFFFKPFFSAHWKQFWKEGRLIKFLRNIWHEIKAFFRYAFTKVTVEQDYSSVQSKKFGESIKDFLKKAGRSKEKTAEIDRLTKHFMKLIDWGEAHEIRYRSNLAPAEYTQLLKNAAAVPDLQEAMDTAGMLFEKALYDKNMLSREEEARFIECVKKILEHHS